MTLEVVLGLGPGTCVGHLPRGGAWCLAQGVWGVGVGEAVGAQGEMGSAQRLGGVLTAQRPPGV